ncbi:arylamine N-acetyltransferase [Halomonas sp. BM-2019]|uniref:arylamine N-acetyltransferase n=1 Tax=Halomonas sp. BM-2019 TaxID=2811227 RepID=UPI001B3C4712|nr:MAG: arylamine N-acetyltransferase [Halomonas sp. BM-2019]
MSDTIKVAVIYGSVREGRFGDTVGQWVLDQAQRREAFAPMVIDPAAYRARIGHEGELSPTLETLRRLQARHVAAIPFENLDILLGRGIDISPRAVETKLIGARRGGYCFEQNALFKRVLEAIGFQVEGLLARVLWMAPSDAPPSRLATR